MAQGEKEKNKHIEPKQERCIGCENEESTGRPASGAFFI